MNQKNNNATKSNFWQTIKDSHPKGNPFFVLAPMADVTDAAFRRIVTKHGKPDVLWTEFVSADGLMLGGREHLLRDLLFTEEERPIVAQLFGANPTTMRAAAKLCTELGFDGIDINMGCPDRSIEKQGAGAATIKTPDVAVQIIRAAKEGIQDAVSEAVANGNTQGKIIGNIPLSVKTRIGYFKNEIETWLPVLLAENLAAITIHCRTRKEMSKVPARWEHIREVTALRDKIAPETLIIGNGDVRDIAHGRELALQHGADGVMIGRSIFGNPWLFSELTNRDEKKVKKLSIFKKVMLDVSDAVAKLLQNLFGVKNRYWLRATQEFSETEKLSVLVEHCELFEQLLGGTNPHAKNFAIMKKHFKAYVHGWPGAKELRVELMSATNSADVARIINNSK
ncbi:MAG: hypothetical protein RL641_768 [Candidatus Parcubacteria bacterium]